jgi:hypothetical protein
MYPWKSREMSNVDLAVEGAHTNGIPGRCHHYTMSCN